MKANAENLNGARPYAHLGWQRPDLEIGRARFLAVTARVNWCRSRLGRARIAGGATDNVAHMPGKRFDALRQCRKGKRTKRASRGKNCAQAPSLDLTLLIAVRRRCGALDFPGRFMVPMHDIKVVGGSL